MLHFVDAATTDERFLGADKVKQVVVTDANTVIVYMDSLDPAVTANDIVTLTSTANSQVTALKLAEYITATKIGGNNTLTVKAATAPFAEVSVVAYTAGS